MDQIYKSLNSISNDEFKNILQDKTPVEKYLDLTIHKNVLSYDEKINENNFKITTTKNEKKETFLKYITLVDFLKEILQLKEMSWF